MAEFGRQTPTIALARRLLGQGLVSAAHDAAQAVLKADPGSVDAMVLLALMARNRQDLAEADRLSQAAIRIRPSDHYLRLFHAQNLYYRGDAAAAIGACEQALQLFPGDPDFLILRGMGHENRLEFEHAWASIEPLLSSGEPRAEAYALAGRALHGLGRFAEAIEWMLKAAQDARHPASDRRRIWFQLFKTHDRLGDYEDAMQACVEAHLLQEGRFDPADFTARVDETIATYSAAALRGLARSHTSSEIPVFIVGMPRSGTTLVEQIIDAHPSAFGAGELMDLPNLACSITAETGSLHSYPSSAADLTVEAATRLGDQHLASLRKLNRAASRIVDKMPHNYDHLGLIWQLLPGARVIHMLRDPLDTCLSCYTRQLTQDAIPYAASMEHLGLVYREHERLMKHWKSTLDMPILTVQYETLVGDQKRISRQIIDFLGLPWDDSCLRYWESGRTVMTLSYDQVSKPVYDSSIGRWKNYAAHLDPLKRALAGQTGGTTT